MSDWFKFYNDGLDEPRFQFAISEHSQVTSVWLVILSEASKKRSSTITWRNDDVELFGYSRKINVSVPIMNACIGLLERIGYITKGEGTITIPGWDKLQSDYAKGLDRGYYKSTSKILASDSLVSTTRGEDRRGEKNKGGEENPPVIASQNGNGTAQKISNEKELERITKELLGFGALNDYAIGSVKYVRLTELRNRQKQLRTTLGVIA